MLKFPLAVLGAAFLLSACTSQESPTAPEPVAQVCGDYLQPIVVLQSLWSSATWRPVNAAYVPAIGHYMNNQEPQTDWDVVDVFIVVKGGLAALVLELSDGCAWTSNLESPGVIAATIKAAIGAGA